MGVPPLKTYSGVAATPERKMTVLVRDGGGKHSGHQRKLAHHYVFSKDGFNWGFDKYGPSELARSLLLDAFGQEDCPSFPEKCQCISTWVEPTYEAFKSDIITKMERDQDWKLEQLTVCEWVFDYMRGQEGISELESEANQLEGSPR